MPEYPVFRRFGDTYIASGHDRGRWMWAAGPAFPDATMPVPHNGALFFRTDLRAHYVYDAGTWTLIGGGGLHAASHQDGGADEISVLGLSGLLADAQTPLAHNIITAHNGFPGGTTDFLRADGAFAAPPAGGSPPTGTGFRHVTGGVEDVASKLVDTADINADQVTYAKIQNVSATDKILGRATAGAGDVEEIACTAAGRALIDDATAGDQRTTLGLGTMATVASPAPIGNGGTGQTTAQAAIDALTAVAGATNEHVLTKDTATGNAIFKAGGSGTNPLTKVAGATGAAGADITWEVLTANSASITGTGFVTVMELTGVGAGRYHFKCELIYQTTAGTTGINVTATHTGTTTTWIMRASVPTTGAAATSKNAAGAAQAAAGGMWETEVERTKGAAIGTLSNFVVGVDTAGDHIVVIEGSFIVTVSGDFQIQLSAELAALVCTAREGSFLQLLKLS